MKADRLFLNGRSQAVRLPREFRFEGDHVSLKEVVNLSMKILPDTDTCNYLIRRRMPELIRDLERLPHGVPEEYNNNQNF